MRKVAVVVIAAIVVAGVYLIGTRSGRLQTAGLVAKRVVTRPSRHEVALIKHPRTAADKIVNGAKVEAIRGVSYNAAYQQISYPMGDVPEDRGACTDVVIRALRNAGFDLQQLIHEDMTSHFDLYPKKWGLSSPDSNIDHRRVPNQMAFFKRFGKTLPNATQGEDLKTWRAGDIVCWRFGSSQTHTGVVSNVKNAQGVPLVIHNLCGAQEEDCLNSWPIIGHFRYPAGD